MAKKSRKFKELSTEDFLLLLGEDKGIGKTAKVIKTEKPTRKLSAAALSPDSALGSDGSTFSKLKKGKFKTEARLDLHGFTLANAYDALMVFVEESYLLKRRCIMVITGKGKRSAAGHSTINSEFAAWLNQPALRKMITAFSYAEPDKGGKGAFYILLKR